MRIGLGSAAFLAVAWLSPQCGAAQAQTPARTTLDSVYTAEQAARGKAIYQRVCSACHALDYYSGETLAAWKDAPIYDFFELIRTRMPEDNPGSLRRREYLDMLAYILELNGMPPGESELPTGAGALRQIVFRWRNDR